VGSNNNASDNNVVVTPLVKKVNKGGQQVDFPAFNAYDWSACIATHGSNNWGNISGNMWAPDIIWNPTMNK
jgi:arabinan endo-1,5-alpha-L-arabinosidase